MGLVSVGSGGDFRFGGEFVIRLCCLLVGVSCGECLIGC